jgi:hypothetical protein
MRRGETSEVKHIRMKPPSREFVTTENTFCILGYVTMFFRVIKSYAGMAS